jgi:hypothetical protein
MKNTLDLNLTPLHLEQVVYHWAIKAILYSILSTVVKGATNLETLQTILNLCIPDKEWVLYFILTRLKFAVWSCVWYLPTQGASERQDDCVRCTKSILSIFIPIAYQLSFTNRKLVPFSNSSQTPLPPPSPPYFSLHYTLPFVSCPHPPKKKNSNNFSTSGIICTMYIDNFSSHCDHKAQKANFGFLWRQKTKVLDKEL